MTEIPSRFINSFMFIKINLNKMCGNALQQNKKEKTEFIFCCLFVVDIIIRPIVVVIVTEIVIIVTFECLHLKVIKALKFLFRMLEWYE